MNWISVDERLPETHVLVLAHERFGVVGAKTHIAYRSFLHSMNGFTWFSTRDEKLDVTHWMPLPPPPEAT